MITRSDSYSDDSYSDDTSSDDLNDSLSSMMLSKQQVVSSSTSTRPTSPLDSIPTPPNKSPTPPNAPYMFTRRLSEDFVKNVQGKWVKKSQDTLSQDKEVGLPRQKSMK